MLDRDIADTIIGLSGATAPSPESFDENTVVRAREVDADPVGQSWDAPPPPAAFPVPTARYRFSLNGQTPLPLDIPALFGREPRSPRITTGAAPRIVVVSSPLREVSSTHLQLHQHGSSVIVTDLRSTNGTVITMPGSLPSVLRPGESVVALPGSLVDIGDGNRIEILSVQRIVPAGYRSFERLVP